LFHALFPCLAHGLCTVATPTVLAMFAIIMFPVAVFMFLVRFVNALLRFFR
jgi:hypothetical protein